MTIQLQILRTLVLVNIMKKRYDIPDFGVNE
jgi:hypothetical protein